MNKCTVCDKECGSAMALRSHMTKHNFEGKNTEGIMETEQIIEAKLASALKLKDLESENSRLLGKVNSMEKIMQSEMITLKTESEKLKELMKQNEVALQKAKEQSEDHPTITEKLIACKDCLPKLAKKVMDKMYETDPKKFQELVCDATTGRCQLVEKETTEVLPRSGFSLGRSR